MQGSFRSLYFCRESNIGSEATSEAQISGLLVKGGGEESAWEEGGVGALERVGWACQGVPRLVLGTQERTFLESPVSVRSAPQGPGSWRTAALLSFRLFIHVQLYGLSFHSHKWTLWPELPFIFARPIGKACNI